MVSGGTSPHPEHETALRKRSRADASSTSQVTMRLTQTAGFLMTLHGCFSVFPLSYASLRVSKTDVETSELPATSRTERAWNKLARASVV